MLGLTHSALRYLLEQFPGAGRATKYQWQHQEPPQVKVSCQMCSRGRAGPDHQVSVAAPGATPGKSVLPNVFPGACRVTKYQW